MYSQTVTPIKSDGQLHRAPPPPPPKAAPPAKEKFHLPALLSKENILILVIAYVLLQSEKPDWKILMALAYILL